MRTRLSSREIPPRVPRLDEPTSSESVREAIQQKTDEVGREMIREIHQRITSAAPTGVEARAWQPIETAPRDGTRILAWDGDCIIVHWSDCSGVSALTPKMGWATRYDDDFMCYDEEYPTHWMPLPPPPE